MPEGDTIFRAARSLGRALVGKPVTGFRSTYPLLTRFHDDTPLTGQNVDRVEARGKWMLMYFSGGGILLSHLLMNGSWHIYRRGERWHAPGFNMRILIENSEFQAVGFKVPVAEMHTARSLERKLRIPKAENDLLRAEFDAEETLERLLAHPHETIADALLNQGIMAGVGNVFKSEICFVRGLHPYRKVATLSRQEAAETLVCAQKLLRANVMEDSPDAIVTFRGAGRRTTRSSNPSENLWVYGRMGEGCRKCGAAIRRRIQGDDARVTFWCPVCQPMPDGTDVDG